VTVLHAIHGSGISLAASAATVATAARRGGFDPASTLPWVVPLMLAAPLVGYVMLLGSVRSRRGAANVGMATLFVMLLATLIFLPIVLIYTSIVFRALRGMITASYVEKNSASLY